MHKHKFYFVGYLYERIDKVYAFRCEECQKPRFISYIDFWKGTP